jgi:hypothetical protein
MTLDEVAAERGEIQALRRKIHRSRQAARIKIKT